MIAGTIRNAVNQMQLVNDWEQKKATGDVVKKQEGMTVTSQEESMIQHFREQLERKKVLHIVRFITRLQAVKN